MPFTIGDKNLLFKGKHLDLWRTEFLDNRGRKAQWEWIGKKNGVVIFAVTPDERVVLIKNFRVPFQQYIIECPAGLLDKENESIEEAARRELLEETGYAVDKLTPLPVVPQSAALTTGLAHFFIGTGAKKISEIQSEDTEDIEVLELPLAELANYYLNNQEFLFNLGILALYHVALELGLVRPAEKWACPPKRRVARK